MKIKQETPQQNFQEGLSKFIVKNKIKLTNAIPKHLGLTPDRMMSIAVNEFRRIPKLSQCEPLSVFGSLLTSYQLGLEIGSTQGLAWILPFWNGKSQCNEAQLIIGYKGYIELAYRANIVLDARAVYADDEFEYRYGTNAYLHHVPSMANKEDGAITHAYSIAQYPDGRTLFEVMSRDQIDDIKSKAHNSSKPSSPWNLHFSSMARKCPIRKLSNLLPGSAELRKAVSLEEDAERGEQVHALYEHISTPEPEKKTRTEELNDKFQQVDNEKTY